MNPMQSLATSSLAPADRYARGLGYFGLGLGLLQLFAPRQITRPLGLEGREMLVRACGAGKVLTGLGALSDNPTPAVRARVVGSALDMALIMPGLSADNPRRGNVRLVMTLLAGCAMLDLLAARSLSERHVRPRHQPVADYSGRSGFARPVEAMRGAADDFETPADMRAEIGTEARTIH